MALSNSKRAKVCPALPAAVAFALLCLYLLTFAGSVSPQSSDGRAMYLVTRALVDRREIDIQPALPSLVAVAPGWRTIPIPESACPTEPAVIGIGEQAGGPFYSKYGIGQSLAAAPLYFAGLQIARLVPPAVHDETAALVTSAYTSLVTAATAALICALALRLGWSRRVSLGLSALFGVATPAWAYTTSFFSEPTLGLCLLGALAAVLWEPEPDTPAAVLVAGCCLGMALLTHAADSVFYVPLVLLYLAARSRPDRRAFSIIVLLVPVVVAVAITGWYDAARFGSPSTSGYGIVGDVHDLHPPHSLKALWEGIYGPLLSPGKGLFWYAPVLLLLPWAIPRFGRQVSGPAAWLVTGLLAVAVLTHANTLIVWLGGWAWGPRFVVPAIPVLVVPLGSLLDGVGRGARRMAWLLGGLGALIQVPAVLLDKNAYIAYVAKGRCIWDAEDLYKWHPAYSPLIGQWGRLFDAATYSTRSSPGRGPNAFDIANGIFVPSPHPWWSLLANQGASPLALALPAAGLTVAAIIAFVASLRIAGAPDE